jgi:hypothetical protein
MEPEGYSLSFLQESAACPYPDPDEFSTHLPHLIFKIGLILSPPLCLGLPSSSFIQVFLPKLSIHFSWPPITAMKWVDMF